MDKCVDGATRPHRLIEPMRRLALEALRRMYLPQQRRFIFCIRRTPAGDLPEGVSRRYTAISLIGLASESPAVAAKVLDGQEPAQVCRSLIEELPAMTDLGEVALTLWSARALGVQVDSKAVGRLRELDPAAGHWPTVEVAWSLTALCYGPSGLLDAPLADAVARRLLATQNIESDLFAHWPQGVPRNRLRGHVLCFADLVYPTQALSHYYLAAGPEEALVAARRCARQMVRLQGPAGQWWWHYDVRTGRVVEKYPVYGVHQDGMGPMALLTVKQAGGEDYAEAVNRSLSWLERAPEIDGSLMDTQAGLIWRKVCRREPNKLSRSLQALVSGPCPSLRVPRLNWLFPPKAVDWESRPYHMGWILHAFGPQT